MEQPSLESLRLIESSKSKVDEPSSSRQSVDTKKKASKGMFKLNEHPIKYTITLHKNGEDLKEEEPEKVPDAEDEDEDDPMDDEADSEAEEDADEDDAEEEDDDEIAEDAAENPALEVEEIAEDAAENPAPEVEVIADDVAENPAPEVEEIDEDAVEVPPPEVEIADFAEQNPPVKEEKVSKGKEVMVEEDEKEKPPETNKIKKFISGRQLLRRLKEGLFGRTEDLAEHLPKIIESNLKYEVDIPKDDTFHIRDYPGECDKLLAGVVPAIWIFNDYGDRFPLTYEIAMSGVEFALEYYNNENGTHYERVSIEKVNMRAGDLEESKYFSEFFTYSINFTANDVELGTQTFRAKMERYSHDDTPWFIVYCKTKAKKVKSR